MGRVHATLLACGLCSLAALGAPAPGLTDAKKFEFQRGPVPATDLKIELAAGKAVIKGQRGLVLPLKITNASAGAIKTRLAHEWHGGLWPPTSLHASVASEGDKEPTAFAPVGT
jgi:hypothetical protein